MIFFQWAVLRENRQHRTVKLLYDGTARLCLSPLLMDEISDVLTRPELLQRFPELTTARTTAVLEQAEAMADWFDSVPNVFTWPQHPDDDHLFNLAIHAQAEYLVTWESRLLRLPASSSPAAKRLHELAPALSIVTPKELAARLKAQAPKQSERE